MADVMGIGAALFDMLMTATRMPAEDTKLQSDSARSQCGGPCATALVAAAKLGVSAGYIGTLGDDLYGCHIRQQMERYGVEMAATRTIPGATSFHSFVLLNTQTATRTCIWNRGNLPPPAPEDIDPALIASARVLHLDGHQLEAAIRAAQLAREAGVAVSLDAGAPYPGIQRLLPLVDILIPSEECALALTGCAAAPEAAQALARQYSPQVLILTQGRRGGFIHTPQGPVRYPVYPVEAIDTNGAGDTFHGAFLAARLRGLDVPQAAAFASAASALKCTRFGAQEGIPGWTETLAFQQSHQGVLVSDKKEKE